MKQPSTIKLPYAWERNRIITSGVHLSCFICFIPLIFYLTTYTQSNLLFSYSNHFVSSRFPVILIFTLILPIFTFYVLTLFPYNFLRNVYSSSKEDVGNRDLWRIPERPGITLLVSRLLAPATPKCW